MEKTNVLKTIQRLEKLALKGVISKSDLAQKKKDLLQQLPESARKQFEKQKQDKIARNSKAPATINEIPKIKSRHTSNPNSSANFHSPHVYQQSAESYAYTRQQSAEARNPLDSSLHYSSNTENPPLLGLQQTLSNRYQIKNHLGNGSMGQIYLAEDLRFGGDYALKVIHPWIKNNAQLTHRFIQEFKITEKLTHPGIVRTYVLDEDPQTGLLFYTMEYAFGDTLSQLISLAKKQQIQMALTPEELFSFTVQLSEILHFSHIRGIVHRDLKPTNIILTEGELSLKLLNFGIGKIMDGNPTFNTGQSKTFYYMAPEQLNGEENITPAADVFSFGAILYLLITGEAPLGMLTPPSEINPLLNQEIDQIIQKAMQPKAEKRYQSLEDMLARLLSAFENCFGLSLVAQEQQEDSFQSPQPTPNLNRKTSSLNSLHQIEAHQDKITALAINQQGKLLASVSEDQHLKIWDTSNWFLMHTFHTQSSGLRPLFWNQQGNLLLLASEEQQQLQIWDIYSTSLQHIFQHETPLHAAAWDQTNRFLASGGEDKKIYLWERESGGLLASLEAHEATITSLSFSYDGTWLLSGGEDANVRLWDLRRNECTHILYTDGYSVTQTAFLPNNSHFIAATEDGHIRMWNIESGTLVHLFEGPQHSIKQFSLTSQGDLLYAVYANRDLRVWDLHDGSIHLEYQLSPDQEITSLCLAPNGQWLATGGANKQIQIWDLN